MQEEKIKKNKTADIILKNARKLFIDKGFKGVSINDIANLAGLNKSLIYHHFQSKENLWKEVKKTIVQEYTNDDLGQYNFTYTTLKDLLENFMSLRFNVYAHNPDLARLVLWQKLENNTSISGIDNEQLDTLIPQIAKLQQTKEIRSDISAEVVNYIIFSTTSSAFIDRPTFIKDDSTLKEYFNDIIKLLYSALKIQND